MKKITTILAVAMMMALLAGCGTKDINDIISRTSDSSSDDKDADTSNDDKDADTSNDDKDADTSNDDKDSDSDEDKDTTGSDDGVVYPDEYGDAEGTYGDIMHTAFFEYTVNSAYLCDEYDGYEPLDGNALLVADVTVNNPYKSDVTMYDTDFQVQWGSDADDAYDYPITFYLDEDETLNDEMLPYEYSLRRYESRNGLLVFEVPEGETYFSISYLEIYDDNSEGDVFFVYFNADYE